MDAVYPMAVSATAVMLTLAYASYLDIRDRRVPFIHWLPMLAIGVCCTVVMLAGADSDRGLIVAYISLVATFLYADYLDNRGRTDLPGMALYYRKDSVFWYLALVLALAAMAWLIFVPAVTTWTAAIYVLFAAILGSVTWMEYRGKFDEPGGSGRNPREENIIDAIGRWYFIPVILLYVLSSVALISGGAWKPAEGLFILLPAVFSGLFYVFGRMRLFGGADAWALIFIAFCVPVFPFTPLLGIPPLGTVAFSALINALLLNLVAPLGIFLVNIARGNRAPLMYMFFGFPVPGDSIRKEWGFVMEDISEKDGLVERKFIGFWDAIRRMYIGEGRIYTKDLREHPEEYCRELELYRKAGHVWISYAVPFIIPIMAGFVTAVVIGDILLAGMTVLAGR